jgi:hypothetical protein
VRTAEVTIETEENIVVRTAGRRTSMWCSCCRRKVEMVTPEQAAAIANVSPRTIYRWVEGERVHLNEVSIGSIFICLGSLRGAIAAAAKTPDTQTVKGVSHD